jgi:hypothetical protein
MLIRNNTTNVLLETVTLRNISRGIYDDRLGAIIKRNRKLKICSRKIAYQHIFIAIVGR